MGSNQSRPVNPDKRSSPQNAYKRNNKRGASDQAAGIDQQKAASEPSQSDLSGCTTRHGTKDPMANSSFNDTTPPRTTTEERTGHTKRVKRRTCSSPSSSSSSPSSARSHSRSATCDSGYSSGVPGSPAHLLIDQSSSNITTGTELSSISWYSPHCAPEGVEEESEDDIACSPSNLSAILAVANNAAAAASSSSSSSPPPYPEQPPHVNSSSHAYILQRLKQSPQDTYEILRDAFERARLVDDPEDKKEAFQAALMWSQQPHDDDNEINDAAAVWVAQCHLEGCGVAQDSALGFSQLRSLADRGCWQAFLPLAMWYLNGVASVQPVDPTIAYQWLSTAAQLNSETIRGSKSIVAQAQLRLGMMLSEGSCADEVLAFHWFQKSASLGNCQAQFIVGTHYELGLQVDKDIERAKEYLLSSAVQDFAPAQAALGIRLVDEGSFDDGIHWLERAVQSDNPRALVKLATMYEDGHGVEQNNELAAFYYKAAANRGYPSAQYRLALRYHFGGLGLEPNHQEADRYLLQAAYAGYPAAQRLLGLMFLEDFTPMNNGYDRRHNARRNRNNVTALEWFRKAAAQGDPRAYVLVGSCYEEGRGVATDYETALEYYTNASQISSSSFQGAAQLAVAQLLLHRMKREEDAFEWFVRAAASPCGGGHINHSGNSRSSSSSSSRRSPLSKGRRCAAHRAKLMVARYYLHGWRGAERDPKRGFDQLMQLATESKDDGHVYYWLGACYEEGVPDVCMCDPQRAFEYYKTAAELDHTDGQFQVAYMLSNGIGVARDRAAAFPYYEKAARKRHKTALFSLGLYYYKGVANVPKDLGKARKCFEEAARLGVPEAMESLASLCMLQASRPVSSLAGRQRLERQQQDRERAIYWFRKAASLGNAAAQRELGKLHDVGQGVPQDYNTAFELFKQAASKKDAVATLLLGSYYQNGHAVEKNLDKALHLYLEAARLGSPIAPFAAGQLYHSINQFENAYAQYKIAASDARLANNRIGKTSKLMVARYILSYIPAGNSSNNSDNVAINCLGNATKQEAFGILLHLAEQDGFAPAFYWLADCYRQGNGCGVDLVQAAAWMKRAADETNDAEAMIKLASMFDEGIGVATDKSKAVYYYKQAADLGHAEAQYQLGLAYWRGLYDVDVNVNEAIRWFTTSAQQKFCESYWALGQMAIENNDQDVALAWWEKAVELGHVTSMAELGKLLLKIAAEDEQHHHHHQHQRDIYLSRALSLLTDAARSGDAEAFFILGHLHQAGTVTAASHYKSLLSCSLLDMTASSYGAPVAGGADEIADPAELLLQRQQEELELATRCYQQAAEMGHLEAMYFAAQLWHSQQQYAAALELYEQAASKGHLLARVMAARYQLIGLGGIPADPPRAYQILLECAEKDQCADAYNTLGQCHEEGLGTAQSDIKALEWYLRSAEDTKDAEAMFRIGRMYASGRVPCYGKHPILEAINWFEFACSTCNHAEANYSLGLYYLYGITDEQESGGMTVVPQDTNAAQYHFEQASAQDHQGAMFELGQLLLSNDDEYSLEDQQYGFEMMDRAAQLGLREAQLELGKLYHSGKEYYQQQEGVAVVVVPQDHERAYDLFCRAAYQKDKMATLFVGFYHEHGIHVPPSFDLAREMYQAAVDLGNKEQNGWWLAELALATLLHRKPELRAEAYTLFKAARDHHPDPSQNAIADIMCAQYQLYGWGGVQVCPEEAFAILIYHAKANNEIRAIVQVAHCYEQGLGVAKDLKLARMWYERLVAMCDNMIDDDDDTCMITSEQVCQDTATALYKSAEFYNQGVAGPKDTMKALTLYKHAADKGCKEAQHHLLSTCHNSSNDKEV